MYGAFALVAIASFHTFNKTAPKHKQQYTARYKLRGIRRPARKMNEKTRLCGCRREASSRNRVVRVA